MAKTLTHFIFDESSKYGRLLRNFLTAAEASDAAFVDVRDVMIRMWNGEDGSLDAHYADIVTFFGVGGYTPTQGSPSPEQLAMAHAMFTDIDTAFSKTSGQRDELYSKFR